MSTKTEATIEDLYKVEGKAELVNGEIVEMPPTGYEPGHADDEVFAPSASTVSEPKPASPWVTTKPFAWTCRTLAKVARSYRAGAPDRPLVFRRGERADAEPAVPGRSMPADDLFAG